MTRSKEALNETTEAFQQADSRLKAATKELGQVRALLTSMLEQPTYSPGRFAGVATTLLRCELTVAELKYIRRNVGLDRIDNDKAMAQLDEVPARVERGVRRELAGCQGPTKIGS